VRKWAESKKESAPRNSAKEFFHHFHGPCLTSIFAAKCAVNKKYNQKANNEWRGKAERPIMPAPATLLFINIYLCIYTYIFTHFPLISKMEGGFFYNLRGSLKNC